MASVAPARQVPLRALVDALDGWQRRPGPSSRGHLRDALQDLVHAVGARGAYLIVDVAPIPHIELGVGTIPRRPGPRHERSLRTAELRGDRGQIRLGDLWLDLDQPTPHSAPPRSSEGAAASMGPEGRDRTPEPAEFEPGAAEATQPNELADEGTLAVDLAVEAAWARARARASAAQMAALDAATRGIAGVLSAERVLQLIVDRVRELASARYAALAIADQEGSIERFITSGITRVERERIGPLPRGQGLLGLIIRQGQTFRIADIATDPRSVGFPPRHPEMHSFLGVPIMVKGRSVGDLYLTNKQGNGGFTEDDQRLVEMFALHAGIAIENARLHEQVQRLVVVEERERIGRDLHDGIIQSIYAVGLSLEDVPELMVDEPSEATARVEKAIESLDTTIRDIRNFIFGLRPELLEQAGLIGGLAALEDEFHVNTLVDVEMSTDGFEEGDLPPEQTAELLSIAREALSNVARHSKATRAAIELGSGSDGVKLMVIDNGVGFEPERPRGLGHQGLHNMRSRAISMGGTFRVQSRPGSGTRIIVELPRRGAASASRGEA